MPHIRAQEAAIFDIPDVRFAGLASPSRGARETSVWKITLAARAAGTPHSLSREEVFVALSGTALAQIGGDTHLLAEGDALIVPAQTEFTLSNPGPDAFVAIAVLPVGGTARIGQAPAFAPPWTL
jgi:mannose-6-phosphate isomerase-like protein (cupin superfamily)